VVRTFGLHEILFLLPEVPPHKDIFGASLEQRLEMMHLAVEDRTYAAVADVFFLTGRDAAERILTWKYDDAAAALRQMFTAFQLIVCDRDGPFHLPDDPLLVPYRQRIHSCTLPPGFDHVSATAVRQRCHQRLPLADLVPPGVARYIDEHKLYVE
jgi:nicotinate-nucleotide adenylyltransferase